MTSKDDDLSLGGEATFAGTARRQQADVSLGDERTLGGADAAGVDTVIDDIEVVDLAARYTIESTLGQGGMGAVLLATDTRLGRKVAIKRILGEAARSKTAIQRFLTEAKSIAALNHPNVVQIYDYGRAKDGPFLIMEYVDGGSLADRCKDGALSLDEAIDLACQICDGLAKAHDAGIVHRDIKPANVLLNRDGLPKLTDFGLAKAEAADHGMTMTGAVMGTPDFMPPEQRRDAAEVDHRSDLWSLAATVYQMVTGRSPKIIRFNDVPTALQDVLARALEDRKDARYQSAREFRDALRTSVHTAAAAVSELGEGQCPSCGVKNESSRKFCRGCGGSLETGCLACSKPMPMWEEICGSCGTKQSPLLADRRQAMAASQAEAEGLLGDFAFDKAATIADQLRNEPHPKLRHLDAWATEFLVQVDKSRADQTEKAVAAMVEAGKHEAAYDYLSAQAALENVPEALRSGVLSGMRESARSMLDRVKKTQAEVRRLESLIKERLATKQVDELLPTVEKYLALQPDREDMAKLREQLLDRRTKQTAARDEAVAAAQACLAAHDYEKAHAALAAVAAAAVTPEVAQLREQAERLVQQVRRLSTRIKEAIAAKQFDGLLGTVDEYLAIKPTDADALRLRQTLTEREDKVAAEISTRFDKARELQKACQFNEAATLLRAVPEARRPRDVQDCLDRCTYLAGLRQAAIATLGKAGAGTYSEAIEACYDYRTAIAVSDIPDTDFRTRLDKVETAHAEEVRSRKMLFISGATAVGIAALIAVIGAGIWIRSASRASELADAIRTSRWDDALAIEPKNVESLVGRARWRLKSSPPNIEGAFADIEKAERQPGAIGQTKPVRAEAHAARAVEQAAAGRIDRASQDLQAAIRDAAPDATVAAAREAIAEAWLGRAEQAVAKGDGSGVRAAVEQAVAAGASSATVAPLRAKGMVLDAVAAQKKGESRAAVSGLLEASLLDSAIVQATLMDPANMGLRSAVIADYRGRFGEAVANKDWDRAMTLVAAATAVDKSAEDWMSSSLASLPPTALASLPVATMLRLPPIRNSVGIELKLIPAGPFTMGQKGGDSDETPHRVTLSRPYYLGVTEVTNAQWKAVMGRVPSRWQDADRPVEQVSWEEAVEFCRKLSASPAERQAGRVYRLPTEAEWEYACRAGTETRWSCGDDESRLGEYAWYVENSRSDTHPVGKKKPNGWGLYDMHGNVWEWCSDWYGDYAQGAVTDPQGSSGASDRVTRGGGWYDTAGICRSANRSGGDPSVRYYDLGFRLALSPSGGKSAGGGE